VHIGILKEYLGKMRCAFVGFVVGVVGTWPTWGLVVVGLPQVVVEVDGVGASVEVEPAEHEAVEVQEADPEEWRVDHGWHVAEFDG
jgi:hypothetical protein